MTTIKVAAPEGTKVGDRLHGGEVLELEPSGVALVRVAPEADPNPTAAPGEVLVEPIPIHRRKLSELETDQERIEWAFRKVRAAVEEHPNDEVRVDAYLGLGMLLGFSG